MKVWMIRHGESETNQNGFWTGWLDVPLTQKGESDATLAREILSKVKFDTVYSSDLMRARRTAEIALPGCEYTTMPMLREINVGSIAGKPLAVILDENNRPMNTDGYGRFGGESTEEFRERVLTFMKCLENEDCENIAIFTHAGFVRRMVDIVLGVNIPRKNLICDNCVVAVFEYQNSHWRLHSWMNLR